MPARKTILPDARVLPRFAGVATFCRFPQICHVAPEHQPVDWAVYGVPFDGAVTYRPGARFGPRAIREESQYVKPHHLEHDVTVTDVMSLADAGDAPVSPYSAEATLAAAAEYAAKLGAPGHTRLLAVGGDHLIALANIRATWALHGRPAGGMPLLHFDSHLDTVDTIWGEKLSHGTVFRRAIEEGLIDPRRMLSVGVKGPLNRRDDLDFARDHGVTLVTRERLALDGPRTVSDFLKRIGDAPAYLSFDVDVVDPAFAPGTGTPSVGGISSAEAIGLLRSLVGVRLAGADVVEVLPDRDVGGVTALLAGQVIMEVVALDAVARIRKPD